MPNGNDLSDIFLGGEDFSDIFEGGDFSDIFGAPEQPEATAVVEPTEVAPVAEPASDEALRDFTYTAGGYLGRQYTPGMGHEEGFTDPEYDREEAVSVLRARYGEGAEQYLQDEAALRALADLEADDRAWSIWLGANQPVMPREEGEKEDAYRNRLVAAFREDVPAGGARDYLNRITHMRKEAIRGRMGANTVREGFELLRRSTMFLPLVDRLGEKMAGEDYKELMYGRQGSPEREIHDNFRELSPLSQPVPWMLGMSAADVAKMTSSDIPMFMMGGGAAGSATAGAGRAVQYGGQILGAGAGGAAIAAGEEGATAGDVLEGFIGGAVFGGVSGPTQALIARNFTALHPRLQQIVAHGLGMAAGGATSRAVTGEEQSWEATRLDLIMGAALGAGGKQAPPPTRPGILPRIVEGSRARRRAAQEAEVQAELGAEAMLPEGVGRGAAAQAERARLSEMAPEALQVEYARRTGEPAVVQPAATLGVEPGTGKKRRGGKVAGRKAIEGEPLPQEQMVERLVEDFMRPEAEQARRQLRQKGEVETVAEDLRGMETEALAETYREVVGATGRRRVATEDPTLYQLERATNRELMEQVREGLGEAEARRIGTNRRKAIEALYEQRTGTGLPRQPAESRLTEPPPPPARGERGWEEPIEGAGQFGRREPLPGESAAEPLPLPPTRSAMERGVLEATFGREAVAARPEGQVPEAKSVAAPEGGTVPYNGTWQEIGRIVRPGRATPAETSSGAARNGRTPAATFSEPSLENDAMHSLGAPRGAAEFLARLARQPADFIRGGLSTMLTKSNLLADKIPGQAGATAREGSRAFHQASADAEGYRGEMAAARDAVLEYVGRPRHSYKASQLMKTEPVAGETGSYKVRWIELVEGRQKPKGTFEKVFVERMRHLIRVRGEIAIREGFADFTHPATREGAIVPRTWSAEFMDIIRRGPDSTGFNDAIRAIAEVSGSSEAYVRGRLEDAHKSMTAASHADMMRAQFEFSRDPKLKDIPHGFRIGELGRDVRIMEVDPFGYAHRFVDLGAARLGVLRNLPPEKASAYRDAFGKTKAGAEHYSDMMRALSGMGVERAFVDPASPGGAVLRGANDLLRFYEGLIISNRLWQNIPESLGATREMAGTARFGRALRKILRDIARKGSSHSDPDLGIIENYRTMGQMLERMGAVTADRRNWGWNPNRRWNSFWRIAREGVEVAAGARFLEQFQEVLAAGVAHEMTVGWRSRRGTGHKPTSMRDRADIREIESMGLTNEQAQRMVRGEGTPGEYREFIVTAPKRIVSANAKPQDLSRWQNKRAWKQFLPVTRWATMNLRRTGVEMARLHDAVVESRNGVRSGEMTKLQAGLNVGRAMSRLGLFAANRALVGNIQYFLYAFATGQMDRWADEIDEDGLAKFAMENMVGNILAGPYHTIFRDLTRGDATLGRAARTSLPVSAAVETYNLATGSGPYEGLETWDAIDRYREKTVPLSRVGETIFYGVGFGNENVQEAKLARRRYWSIRYDNELFADHIPPRSKKTRDEDDQRFFEHMKRAARAMETYQEKAEVAGHIRQALGIRGKTRKNVVDSLRARLKVEWYRNWRSVKDPVKRRKRREQYFFLRKSRFWSTWVREDDRIKRLMRAYGG